jgi:hypothetical protein
MYVCNRNLKNVDLNAYTYIQITWQSVASFPMLHEPFNSLESEQKYTFYCSKYNDKRGEELITLASPKPNTHTVILTK